MTGRKLAMKAPPPRHGPNPSGATLRAKPAVKNIVLVAALGLAVAAVTALVHAPALTAQAIAIDDDQYLLLNERVQQPSWAHARAFLAEVLEPRTVQGYYQPLAMISLMLDTAAGGSPENLRPYHRTSLLLHAANACLVVALFHVLFGHPWPAAMIGLLFGLHPLTVESIPWVAERKTVLATFFALWSLILYVHHARRGGWARLTGAGLLYVLALMSKPTTTPLPVLFLLLDAWPLKRLSRRAILEKLPLLVVAAVSAWITYESQRRTAAVTDPGQRAWSFIPLVLAHNIVFYLQKFVWPVKLSSFYPFPSPMSLSHPRVLAGVIGTSLLAATLLVSLRWTRAWLTGWLFFFIAIFPTMGVIGFTMVVASDKYMYLPMIGFLLPLGWLLVRLWAPNESPGPRPTLTRRRVATAGVVLVLAGLEAWGTREALSHWQDSVERYRYMAGLTPDEFVLHNELAVALGRRGQLDEALQHARRAVELNPNSVDAHHNLATGLTLKGDYDQAIEHYRAVVRLDGTVADARLALAQLLAARGRAQEATTEYEEVLRLRPGDPLAEAGLNALRLRLRR